MTSLTPKLLSKDCYGSRVPGEFIVNLLQNYLETLDKSSFFRTLKAFFSIKSRENDQQTIKNVAHVALELTLNFYKHVKFPHKLVSSLVEIIVFSLTEKELRVLSEEVLELISNSIGREGLKRVFEIELINSGRLYQIFLFWLDQQQSFGNSPMQQKKETSPIPRKEDIYIEQNETHTLIDDSFSQSYTPQRPVTGTQKRQSPTADLRHSFDKALDEADHQDINQLSEILLTEEYLDEPNFGTNIRGLDTEGSKTGPERQEMRELSNIPSLSQFKQSIRSEFGMGDLVSDKKEFNKRENLHEKKPSRAILGERNLDDFQKSLERVEFNERNFKADKENVQDVNRMTGGWNNQGTEVKREKRDDSAEKWKEKFLQEKGRLQQTIELLEKANQGFFNQMSEKSDLVGKLNQQRQMNESLLEKFNGLSSENEKLKKEAQAFEMERERLSQHSMVLNSTLLNSRPDLKKIRNHKFVMGKNLVLFIINFVLEALPIAARSHGRNTEEFIKQFQEVLLTSDNLEYEIGENLMKIYEDFEEYDEKVQFVINLKTSISHPQVINNLSIQNHKFLLEIALKLCISVIIILHYWVNRLRKILKKKLSWLTME